MKLKRVLNLSAVVAVMMVCLAVVAHAENFQTHHVFPVVTNGQAKLLGPMPSAQVLQVDVMLPVNDKAALDAFVANVYNKSSSQYKKYLTPEQFSAQFGPSKANYAAAVNYLTSHGLTVVGGSWLAMDIQVTGPVSAIESAFNVKMNSYQHPTENRPFYSADREPTTTLSFPLWHVSGLDNFSIPQPALLNREQVAKERGIKPEQVSPQAVTGSGPNRSFLGSDMRAAYMWNLNPSYNGSGQYIGLFEFVGTDLQDLKTYYTNVHQTNHVPVTVYSTDGTETACIYTRYGHWCDDTEQTLDMTQALGMAPGASGLTMFVGSTDSAIIGSITTREPLVSTVGCSWQWYPVDPTTLDPLFERMATQGQSFFIASGDSGNWDNTDYSYFSWPADDPYVTTVGGTDLSTTGAGGAWASETAWIYSGGGVSINDVTIPYWQQYPGVINDSNGGSTAYRNGPDVAANANFSFYVCADLSPCTANDYGGTSFAAPMWAGLIADINQWTAINEVPNAGFINPAIYDDNAYSIYYDLNWYPLTFNDITNGAQFDGYPAVSGYDLVTGWGSPKVGLFYYFAGFCEYFECEV